MVSFSFQMKTDAASLQIALDCEKKLRQDTETIEKDSLSATRLNKSVGLGDIEKLTEVYRFFLFFCTV